MSTGTHAHEHFANVRGTSLAYSTVGEGKRTVLVMHGGLGFDASYLRPWLDLINPTGRVVFYDHRGNGASAEPSRWESVTHETWVDDADALREFLGSDQVIVFGHSYGGFLALEYALRYPSNTAALILCSTAPSFKHGERVVENAHGRGTAAQAARVLDLLNGPLKDDGTLAKGMHDIMSLYFHDTTSSNIRAISEQMTFRVGAFNRAFYGCVSGYDVSDRLFELEMPTLVMGGDDDWIMPLDLGSAQLQRGIKNASLVNIAHSGHFPFIEKNQEFVNNIQEWIGKLAG